MSAAVKPPSSDPVYLDNVRKALVAARSGDFQAMKSLVGPSELFLSLDYSDENLGDKVDPNSRDNKWRTLLMYACGFGHLEIVDYLATNPWLQVNARDDWQMTALHHACWKNSKMREAKQHDPTQAELVKALLDHGANVSAVDDHGITPLMIAVNVQDRCMVSAILEVADEDTILMKDFEGYDAMDYAQHRDDMKMGCLLYTFGGMDVPQNEWGRHLCEFIDDNDGEYSISEGEEDWGDEEPVPTPNFMGAAPGGDGDVGGRERMSEALPGEAPPDEEPPSDESDEDAYPDDIAGTGKKDARDRPTATWAGSGADAEDDSKPKAKKKAGAKKKAVGAKKKAGAKKKKSTDDDGGGDDAEDNKADDGGFPSADGDDAGAAAIKPKKKKVTAKKKAPKKKAAASSPDAAADDDAADGAPAAGEDTKAKAKKKPKKKAGSASTKSAAAAKGSAVKGTKGKVVARVSRNSLMGGGGWGGANFDDDIQIEDNSHAGLIKQLEDALQSKNLFVIEKAITHAKGSDDHDVEDSDAFQKCVTEADALRKKQAATEAVCHACDDFEKEVHAADFDAAKNLKPAFQKLENALKKAQQAKIDEPIALKHVNEVFDAAKGRVETREKLEKMCASADAASLKAELAKLKAAPGNLTASDLTEFEEKLEAFANVKKAEDALKAVLAKKPIVNYIDALKAAIAGLRSCGGDVGEAEKVLKQEEPKKLALDALRDAMMNAVAGNARASTDSTHSSSAANDTEIASVEKALQACKKLNIVASDDIPVLAEAGNWIENEKRKQQLLKQIKEFMERTKSFEKMEEIEALKALEQECGKMFKEAKEVGILEAELGDLEVRKKKLHNKVEDLKGSIRVFVRVRPFNKREEELGDHNATQRLDAQSLSVDGGEQLGKKEFTFDAAHFPGTQAEIFEDTKDLVQSAFDGYNVTIFAYGQTGAGKTYTMTGKPNDEGVVPRACREVFTIVEREKERFTFTVTIHMVELYCAKFTDLLIPKSTNGMKAPEVKVRREKDGSIQVENAAERQVQSAEGMEKAIETGFNQRQVAATAMNSESSRSHLVTIVKLTSVNKETKQKTMGKLLMCDLAGCERIAKSEVTGQAQKEAIEINKSLTALGDVIEALTKAAPGKKVNLSLVPYRNHQLTQLMQDSLGGTAKTLMFMNCSPSSSNVDETMNSLKYAERAKKVQNTIKK